MALLDYLSERREVIEAQMKALKAELAEIRIAEAALRGETPAKRATVIGGATIRVGTIKDWIMKALAEYDASGLETEEIIDAIARMGGPRVERSSITPQLSRLKSAKLIALEGRCWRLPSKEEKVGQVFDEMLEVTARKNETPDAVTSGASDDEEDLIGSLA